MDRLEKYLYWVDIAQYDLETARAMMKSGRYLYVVFMCQQSIEKLVKGLYVVHLDEEPPRSHNILMIFKRIFVNKTDKELTVKKEEYGPFFVKLLAYYISERYPSYKEKLSSAINHNEAEEVLRKTEEVFVWLKSLSKY